MVIEKSRVKIKIGSAKEKFTTHWYSRHTDKPRYIISFINIIKSKKITKKSKNTKIRDLDIQT